MLQSIRGALSVDQYWQLVEERNQYRHRFPTALDAERFDALLCAPYALPAPAHGSSGALNVTNAGSYAILYNLLGLPAGVAPVTRVHPDEESERSFGKDSVERAARAVDQKQPILKKTSSILLSVCLILPDECDSSSQQIHQRKSENRYVYLLVHIHRYTEVAPSLGKEPFTSPQESEEQYAKKVYPVAY